MRISDIPTQELLTMLAATERTLGRGAVEVRILRREVARRAAAGGSRRGAGQTGGHVDA